MIDFDNFDIEETKEFNPNRYINYVDLPDREHVQYIIRAKAKDLEDFSYLLDRNGYRWNSGAPIPSNIGIFTQFMKTFSDKINGIYYVSLIVIKGKPGKRLINSVMTHGDIIIDYK